MSTSSDPQIMEFGGFHLLRGDRFLEARNSAANEIMRRNVAGETRETWDNIFYFPHTLEADLDEPLMGSGRLPDLGTDVPVASWVLARLRQLTPEYVPVCSSVVSDGGGYSYDFYLLRGKIPVAWLQLQGGMSGVSLLGEVKEPPLTGEIPELVLALLLDRPAEVAICTVEVIDPDWEVEPDFYVPTPDETSRNRYGWNGAQYLGAGNIREVL